MNYRFLYSDTAPVYIKGRGVMMARIGLYEGAATIVPNSVSGWRVADISLDGTVSLGLGLEEVAVPLAMTNPLRSTIELHLLGPCRETIDRMWAQREQEAA